MAELYDLGQDPGEARNLAESRPALVAELVKRINQRFSGLTDRGRGQEVPEELKEELKALGYVAR